MSFVAQHLGHLASDEVHGSSAFVGGQRAADEALAAFDVAGYAGRRSEVWPASRSGASRLSPYIRHGLLHLGEVFEHVAGGPPRDVEQFRDELLWQEYSRHWYARLGTRTIDGVRHRLPEAERGPTDEPARPDHAWAESFRAWTSPSRSWSGMGGSPTSSACG